MGEVDIKRPGYGIATFMSDLPFLMVFAEFTFLKSATANLYLNFFFTYNIVQLLAATKLFRGTITF